MSSLIKGLCMREYTYTHTYEQALALMPPSRQVSKLITAIPRENRVAGTGLDTAPPLRSAPILFHYWLTFHFQTKGAEQTFNHCFSPALQKMTAPRNLSKSGLVTSHKEYRPIHLSVFIMLRF